jgi:hypothetical protein
MEKADELRSEFGCDIYVLGQRNGKLFNYISRDGPSWPLSLTEVVSGILLIQGLYSKKNYRIRVILGQRDIHRLAS